LLKVGEIRRFAYGKQQKSFAFLRVKEFYSFTSEAPSKYIYTHIPINREVLLNTGLPGRGRAFSTFENRGLVLSLGHSLSLESQLTYQKFKT